MAAGDGHPVQPPERGKGAIRSEECPFLRLYSFRFFFFLEGEWVSRIPFARNCTTLDFLLSVGFGDNEYKWYLAGETQYGQIKINLQAHVRCCHGKNSPNGNNCIPIKDNQ